jgi:hypothetical protein
MCDIPMDLERRFERRWAARFSGPAKEHRLEEQQHQPVTAPDESKTRNRRTGEREPETRRSDDPAEINPRCGDFTTRGAWSAVEIKSRFGRFFV